MTFSPDRQGQHVTPIRRNTSPVQKAARLTLTSPCKYGDELLKRAKRSTFDETGTFGQLNGQTDRALGQQRKATAISAAQSATGLVSLSGSGGINTQTIWCSPRSPCT